MPEFNPPQSADEFARLVDRIAAVVTQVGGVRGLYGGSGSQVASSFLPGRRVDGVRVTRARCEVHIVVDLTADPPDRLIDLRVLARDIRRALQPVVADLPVDVFIRDVFVEDDELGPTGAIGALRKVGGTSIQSPGRSSAAPGPAAPQTSPGSAAPKQKETV